MEKEIYSEVRCDCLNDENFWSVDAWRTSDDNEEGKVVAVIHDKSGDVYYIEPEARFSPRVKEVVDSMVDEIRSNKPSFNERYQALAQEEIEDLRVALAKAGGSYRFENAFIKVIAALGGFTEDYEFCIVRSAELNDDGRITIEVEANYQTYDIDAGDILENQIHYITEEIEA